MRYLYMFVVLVAGGVSLAGAQQNPVLIATLDGSSPASQALSSNAQSIDFARITLTASGGDVFINGVYLVADGYGGLSNFTDIQMYDTSTGNLVASYVVQGGNNGLLQFSPITIGNGQVKTYLVRASLHSTAAGNIRLGFSSLTYATQTAPVLSGFPIFGNAMMLPGVTPAPTPTPTVSVSASPTPAATPSITAITVTPLEMRVRELRDGDIVRSPYNTAVWVIKVVGNKRFKRWMIAPQILRAYGVGFDKIKLVDQDVLDQFPTSYLMRLVGDAKVYELWDIKEGITGSRRWIPTEADFLGLNFDFTAVYTINALELQFYTEGAQLKKRTP